MQSQTKQPVRQLDLFVNDLYQFTCSYSYFLQNKHEDTATFQIFFRKYPFQGQYVIFAGLDSVKDFLNSLKFTQKHQKYLKQTFPHMSQEYFTWIKQDFSKIIKIRSMKQGQIVFANQPLITYTGPLSFIQLLETPFLNLIGFASLVATNASRMVKAVYPKKCLQFGTRRAQGPDGALSAAQYAFIGGFIGTSNIYASQHLDILCVGTMSHAFITSFKSTDDIKTFQINGVDIKQHVLRKKKELGFKTHDGQLAAFLSYCKSFPNSFAALIDTYSTLQSGILNVILVASALFEAKIEKIGIRLDSGDLGQFSKQCRKIWKKYYSNKQLTIIASDDLHEERLKQIQKEGSQIDIYAIGTNIATCKKQPALGLVCKLVELNQIPKMKISSTAQKATYPAVKNVYRITNQKGDQFDLMTLQKQKINESSQIKYGKIGNQQRFIQKVKSIKLLNQEWKSFKQNFSESNSVKIRQYMENQRANLNNQIFALDNPKHYQIFMSDEYLKVFQKTLQDAKVNSFTD